MTNLKNLLTERNRIETRIRELLDLQKVSEIGLEIETLDTAAEEISRQIEAIITAPLSEARLREGKDTGVINLEIDGVPIKQDVPKTVDWDQSKLAGIVDTIRKAGDDPSQYVQVKYSVPETNFKAWPDAIRKVFAPARTVKPGKPKVEFKEVA